MDEDLLNNRLLLIDVPPATRDVLAAALPGVPVKCIDPAPSADRELAALMSAAVAVLSARAWPAWKKIPSEKRPVSFVLLDSESLPLLLHQRFIADGAAGCAPANKVEWLTANIQEAYEGAAQAREDVAFNVGERVSLSGCQEEDVLVGWGAGSSAQVFSTIRSVGSRLRPLLSGAFPLQKVTQSDWLELYANESLGLDTLNPDKRDNLLRQLGQTSDDFRHSFIETLVKRPRYRPQAILILGETGTGKSWVARQLHAALEKATERATGTVIPLPWRSVNCSTLGDLATVHLFGALKGSYTSLDYTNPGALLSGFGGTVFLDELGTLTKEAQEQLLLFLESGSLTPMGWPGPELRVPVLIVAATNERLEDSVKQGSFRADLFHRFRDGRIELPALRATKGRDMPYLVDYLLQTDPTNRSTDTPGTAKVAPKSVSGTSTAFRIRAVGQKALRKLMAHDYPGNFRELQATMTESIDRALERRSTILNEGDIVFRKSILPRQDSVVAVIIRDQEGTIGVLLRYNLYWRNWFLPGGRVVEGETYESCLARELQQKLGLQASDYQAEPIAGAPEIKIIQYSSRDLKVKHYHFFPYRVLPLRDPEATSASQGTRWATVDELKRDTPPPEFSPTLSRFSALWEALPTIAASPARALGRRSP